MTKPVAHKTVKIGPHTYTVKEVERLISVEGSTVLYGQIRCAQQTIEIEKGMVGTYKRQTIWHEVVHGILEGAGIRDDHDERLIDALSTGIVQVLQDNPWLRS